MVQGMIRIGKAAKMLGVTVQTLRNWEKSGKLKAHRGSGGNRYYRVEDIQDVMIDLEILGWAWAVSDQVPQVSGEYYCERQDRFTSRLGKMSSDLLNAIGQGEKDIVSLLVLVAGEIGDNSFAHNIGSWFDVPGIFFAYSVRKRVIVLADRGRGVKTTLQQVRKDLDNDVDALRVAFTEIISGRDPEKRGNGLKVVRNVAEKNEIGVNFRSGLAVVDIAKFSGKMRVSMTKENVRGTYTVIRY